MALTVADSKELMALIGKMNATEAKNMARLLNDVVEAEAGKSIRVGDTVSFKPRKTKPTITGVVKRISGKTCTIVDCTGWSAGGPGWRIPHHMLTVV